MFIALNILGGALLGIGFLASGFWAFSFIGAAFFVASALRARSTSRAFFGGWSLGCVLYGMAYGPVFWNTLPLDWAGAFPTWIQVCIVAGSWALSTVVVSLVVGVSASILHYGKNNSWRDIVLIAAFWPLSEWMGAWIFSLLSMGTGSVIAPHFSLGFVGTLLAQDVALLQLASVGGVYLLSAFIFTIGALLVRLLWSEKKERYILLLVLGSAILLVVGGHILIRNVSSEVGKSIRIALITTQDSPILVLSLEERARRAASIEALLSDTRGADVVVLPENADFLRTLRAREGIGYQLLLERIYSEKKPIIADPQTLQKTSTLQTRIEYYDVGTKGSTFSYKYFLLPDGEYVPYLARFAIGLLGWGTALDTVYTRRTYESGPPPVPVHTRVAELGGLFCDEALSPILYRSLARAGAGVFLNTASHSWFHGSHVVFVQMQNTAKVRAVESRRWYAQASNAVPSFVLDAYGRVVVESAWGETNSLIVDVYPRTDTTPYALFGNNVLFIAVGILLWIMYRRYRYT